jgi:hypothetical protein
MYAWEKFYLASKTLKQSKSNTRQALENAYTNNIIRLRDDDLPEELVEDFRKIKNAVTLPEGMPPIGRQSGCSHAISSLSDQEIGETISLIHSVYDRLEIINSKNT